MAKKWRYRVKDIKTGYIKEGDWVTELSASEICKWFEKDKKEILRLVYLEPSIILGMAEERSGFNG